MPRYFNSSFSLRVKPGDIRLNPTEQGGGPVYDIGVYCINAARYLFQDEPTEVTALVATGPEPRFRETHETMSAVMRFPEERIAAFTCSFGATDVSAYRVVGTAGDLVMEPAYEYAEALKRRLTVDGDTKKKSFRKRDQFAPELVRFSEAVLAGTEPEPSGYEGLADVRIVEALLQSAREGRTIRLSATEGVRPYPDLAQELHRPAIRKPEEVHASGAGED
jgi:glucose-fructose oxidoreductase